MYVQPDPDVGQVQAEKHFRGVAGSDDVSFGVFLRHFVELDSSESERERAAHVGKNIDGHAGIERKAELQKSVFPIKEVSRLNLPV